MSAWLGELRTVQVLSPWNGTEISAGPRGHCNFHVDADGSDQVLTAWNGIPFLNCRISAGISQFPSPNPASHNSKVQLRIIDHFDQTEAGCHTK